MKKYTKPEVVESAHSPEPVEAGCCLTSCGGSPRCGGDDAKGRSLVDKVDQAVSKSKE